MWLGAFGLKTWPGWLQLDANEDTASELQVSSPTNHVSYRRLGERKESYAPWSSVKGTGRHVNFPQAPVRHWYFIEAHQISTFSTAAIAARSGWAPQGTEPRNDFYGEKPSPGPGGSRRAGLVWQLGLAGLLHSASTRAAHHGHACGLSKGPHSYRDCSLGPSFASSLRRGLRDRRGCRCLCTAGRPFGFLAVELRACFHCTKPRQWPWGGKRQLVRSSSLPVGEAVAAQCNDEKYAVILHALFDLCTEESRKRFKHPVNFSVR